MPRAGGEADKFGNRYESLWTVDAVLDLIDSEYADLTVEAIGDEAAGVEFFRTDHRGVREYHSIKRQQSDGNWTLSRLTWEGSTRRSILGDLFRKIREGHDGVFTSGTSASVLEELVGRAKDSSSFSQFSERLGVMPIDSAQAAPITTGAGGLSEQFRKLVRLCDGAPEEAYEALRHLCVRTKNESVLRKDVERRVRLMFRMADSGVLDPTAVHLLIADFSSHNLGSRLTAESCLSYLDKRGIVRLRVAGDSSFAELLGQLNRAYLREVRDLLINKAQIVRQETDAACGALLTDKRSVMIEGAAGGGKTGVVAQVVERLQKEGIPCLVVRLDRLTEGDRSARALGTNRGLPESHATTLGEFAGERPSVLCIDQLDALSFVSARQQWAWDTLNQLLDEAATYPNMRILFSCRSFDLEQDARLRGLVGDHNEVERIRVGLLDDDTVRAAIDAAGLATPSLGAEQIQVLSTPLHLYLFLEASGLGQVDFRAPGDLFEAFWLYKERAVGARAAPNPSGWLPTISALCDALSERESPSVPDYVMDSDSDALLALASEGVVSTQGGSVSFFHESFFDYAFARIFLGADKDLVDWLVLDEQALFRRSQVRQVLAFLRDREGPDSQRYLGTVARLLDDGRVRFHIKRLVLDWLNSLARPTSSEWDLIEAREESLGGHVWGVVNSSVPWFDLLHRMGRWEQWLTADGQRIDRAVIVLSAPQVLDERADSVAELVQRHRSQSEEWRGRAWRLVGGGDGYASAKMQQLLIDLVADGTLDVPSPPTSLERDIWTVLYGPTTEYPELTARVLGAWFDRQVVLATERGSTDPFEDDFALQSPSHGSEHVIEECAKLAPKQFARELFSRLAALDRKLPHHLIHAPGSYGGLHEQLREALGLALEQLAESDTEGLNAIIEPEAARGAGCTKWMSALLLRAWSAIPESYAEQVVTFLLEHPDERLWLEYDISTGLSDSLAAISRGAVAAASPHCSEVSFRNLETAILNFTPDWEWEFRPPGRTRLALLRALDQERIAEATQKHIRELERKFPEAQEHGAPEPPGESGAHRTLSPVPGEALAHMSDENWLSAMTKYSTDGPIWTGDEFVGGAGELARDLQQAARAAPERFGALANRMDESFAQRYFEAILSGLTRAEESEGRAGTVAQACSVLRWIKELGVDVPGQEIAHAIRTMAEEDLPDDIVDMLCRVAREDPSPESDDKDWEPFGQAINSGRGAAAFALARLLFADRKRWSVLQPTVERLVSDPVPAVRSVAVECLTAVLDTNREDALLLFERLVDGADSILATDQIERFIHYAIFRDYLRLRPILHGMLASTSPSTVEVGARQIVVAALWGDTRAALVDEEVVLRLGEDACVGAAKIYAANLSDPTVGLRCEAHLRKLFDDESESVRRAAGHCWGSLTPEQIASRGEFIGAFARSRAFIDSRAGYLLHRLEEAKVQLPMEVCALAERALEEYGSKATSTQTAEGGDAYGFSKLMVRLHEETSDPALRKRILDVIDGMVRAGFLGIRDRLRERCER